MIEWIDSNKELPKERTRFIGYCCDGECWSGIQDVYFSPTIGWRKCLDKTSVEVLFWAEYPNLPKGMENY